VTYQHTHEKCVSFALYAVCELAVGKELCSIISACELSRTYATLAKVRRQMCTCCIIHLLGVCDRSCDGGNLRLEIVRSRGSPLPHVAMFASKDIQTGGEMTFSYGSSANSVEPTSFAAKELHVPLADTVVKLKSNQRRRCVCCTKNCSGYLPGS